MVIVIKITDVKIRKISESEKMKAIVSVTFDDMIVIHDIKIIETKDKLFIAMPSRKTPDGQFRDIAHPVNIEMRKELEQKVLEEYEKYKNELLP